MIEVTESSHHTFFEDFPPYYDPSIEKSIEAKYGGESQHLRGFRSFFEGRMCKVGTTLVPPDPVGEDDASAAGASEMIERRAVVIPKTWKLDCGVREQYCAFNIGTPSSSGSRSQSSFHHASSSSSGPPSSGDERHHNKHDPVFGEYNASLKYAGKFSDFCIIHEGTSTIFRVPLLRAIAQSETIRMMLDFPGGGGLRDSTTESRAASGAGGDDDDDDAASTNRITVPYEVTPSLEAVRSLVIFMFTGMLVDPSKMKSLQVPGSLIGELRVPPDCQGGDIGRVDVRLSFDVGDLYSAAHFLHMPGLMERIASNCVRVHSNLRDRTKMPVSQKQKSEFLAGVLLVSQERCDTRMTDEAIKAVSNLDLMVNPLLNMPARFSRDTWKKMILKGLNRTFMFSPTSFAAYAVLFGLEDMSELDDMIEELKGKAFRRFDFPPPPVIGGSGEDHGGGATTTMMMESLRTFGDITGVEYWCPPGGLTSREQLERVISRRRNLSDIRRIIVGGCDDGSLERYNDMARVACFFDFYVISTMVADRRLYGGCNPNWLRWMLSEIISIKGVASLRNLPAENLERIKHFALLPFFEVGIIKKPSDDDGDNILPPPPGARKRKAVAAGSVDIISLCLMTDLMSSQGGAANYEDIPAETFVSQKAAESIFRGIQLQAQASSLGLSVQASLSSSSSGSSSRKRSRPLPPPPPSNGGGAQQHQQQQGNDDDDDEESGSDDAMMP